MILVSEPLERTLNEKLGFISNAFFESLIPPPDLTLSEWSDRHRVLPRTASSEPGPWRTSRFPFTKEIMDCLSPQSPYQEVVWQAASQIGKTEISLNLILYTIHYSPGPMLYVQKTVDAVERFSKQRLTPSIEESPEVLARIGPSKSRDGSNTIFLKQFPGGLVILGGANSPSGLASMPIQRLLLDEIDRFESNIDEEGDPIEIARRRTSNFPRRKIYYCSSPGYKETSQIEPLFEKGDQRRFYVPCPACGTYQIMTWPRIKWEKDQPDTVKLECEHCLVLIEERFKPQMLAAGEWRATYPGRPIASFSLSALYSPLGFYSWSQAVADFLSAKRERNRTKLQVFINTVLGETFSLTGKTLEASAIEKRKEHYSEDVPAGALILTCGADVQEDRIEAGVIGWGKDDESWFIDYSVFVGDTEMDFVWKNFDDYLKRTWMHESGQELNIAAGMVDSGHRAQVVYNFCRRREFRRIFPVKGDGGLGKGYIRRPDRRNKSGVMLYLAHVDEIKSKIYSQLSLDTPGPGFVHFPKKEVFGDQFFRMMTAENRVTRRVNGQPKLVWDLPAGRRNEALDVTCYAFAAVTALNVNFDELEKRGPITGRVKRAVQRTAKVLSKGVQ